MQEHWIMPCSFKFFDIVSHFDRQDTIVWRRVSALHEGDIAYIYVGSPYSEIRYKCVVINDNVCDELLEDNKYAIRSQETEKRMRYVQLKLVSTFADGILSLEKLREHGLGQTQKQARTDRRLQAFISEIEAEKIG